MAISLKAVLQSLGGGGVPIKGEILLSEEKDLVIYPSGQEYLKEGSVLTDVGNYPEIGIKFSRDDSESFDLPSPTDVVLSMDISDGFLWILTDQKQVHKYNLDNTPTGVVLTLDGAGSVRSLTHKSGELYVIHSTSPTTTQVHRYSQNSGTSLGNFSTTNEAHSITNDGTNLITIQENTSAVYFVVTLNNSGVELDTNLTGDFESDITFVNNLLFTEVRSTGTSQNPVYGYIALTGEEVFREGYPRWSPPEGGGSGEEVATIASDSGEVRFVDDLIPDRVQKFIPSIYSGDYAGISTSDSFSVNKYYRIK